MNEPKTPADNQNAPMAVASGAVLGWLRVKLQEAETALIAREQSEATWRSGDDASWNIAAGLHPSTVGRTLSKKGRLEMAERQARIAAKIRNEIKTIHVAIAIIGQPNEKADLPPTRDVNRDSGTDSANGGWPWRLVRPTRNPNSKNEKDRNQNARTGDGRRYNVYAPVKRNVRLPACPFCGAKPQIRRASKATGIHQIRL